MASNLNGWGQFALRQEDGLRIIRAAGVSIAEEVAAETAQAFPSGATGVLSAVDTFGSSRTTTITLTLESVDSSDFDLIAGYTTADQTSVSYPVFEVVTVPASSPYEVTVTGLTLDQAIEATLITSVAPGNLPMTQDTTAPAATLEFQVTAGKVEIIASSGPGTHRTAIRSEEFGTSH